MNRRHKQAILLLVDVSLAPLALLLSVLVMFPGLSMQAVAVLAVPGMLCVAGVALVTSVWFGVPKVQLKSYEGAAAVKSCSIAVLSAVGLVGLGLLAGAALPVSAVVLFVFLFAFAMVAARIAMLQALLAVLRFGKVRATVIIYGAGSTGSQLAAALRGHESIRAVAFVDDRRDMQGLTVQGLQIHDPATIDRLVARHDVSRVLLAIPRMTAARKAAIARDLMARGLLLHSVPSFAELVGAEVLIDTLEPVSPGAFLGRNPLVDLHPPSQDAYRGKCVMVTGAGGSVGAELCRQLVKYRPSSLILLDKSEIALYTVDRDLAGRADVAGIHIVPVLGSVTESRLIRSAIVQHGVDVILHAAAYKHVPLVEANPIAGLVNNVMGTRTLAEAARDHGVKRFILVSTDKAVRPTNVMGASKRLAELVVQDMAQKGGSTDFSIVRFGNVLGSSGSVVPLFKAQIAKGGPVTLTHEDVTRYFMTIAEAASLVLIAGGLPDHRSAHCGDLFVLDMGEPVRIRDLAEQMIRAAGYSLRCPQTPDGDMEIVVTGLRPGEKLHEELLIEPGMLTTPHEKILRVQEKGLTPMQMAAALRDLQSAAALGDTAAAMRVIATYVEGYQDPAAQPIIRAG